MSILQRNAVRVRGEGLPVLLVHGFGCDQAMWNPFEAALGDGFRVIRYDLTGMGSSDYDSYDPRRHASLQGHAKDLLEILDALDEGPVVAVGHSVSAIIVALASIARPERFHSLVMVCPNPRYVDDPPYVGGFAQEDIDGLLASVEGNYQGWAGQLASLVAGSHEETESTLNARFCKNDPWISRHFATVTFGSDNRADLPRVPVPTLVVATSQDVIAPAPVARYVAEHLPEGHLVTLDATGHAPHMSAPEETARAVRTFLQERREEPLEETPE